LSGFGRGHIRSVGKGSDIAPDFLKSDMQNNPSSASQQALEIAVAENLVAAGKLSALGLDRALRITENGEDRIIPILTKLGLVTERDLAQSLADQLDLPLISADAFPTAPLLADQLGANFLRQAKILPLEATAREVTLAMADPLDHYTIRAVELRTGKRVLAKVATFSAIEDAHERLYAPDRSVLAGIVQGAGEESAQVVSQHDVDRLKDLASGAPVIRLANLLIDRAVEMRASDIHIEPADDRLAIRYRVDGALQEVEPPPKSMAAPLISRIKIMARLDIAERRLPQDGRIRAAVKGNLIDMRVSTTPTIHGENVVLRILDRSSIALEFPKLGFDDALEKRFLNLLDQPNGIVLVTGPTGSGKTTTLYTSLRHLNVRSKKLFTVEDPVEYQLDGISQIEIKPQIGLSFAHILRSILRQDPDIVMIGEIRDVETAEIAIQAALTGHLVLSTLHTNSAAATVTRLLDMGVADYLLTSTINGIAAQRLVRVLCTACRETYTPLPEFVEQIGLAKRGPVTLYRARGCDSCRNTGYYGRTTIFELMPITSAIRKLVLAHAEAEEIQAAAIHEGMRTMFDNGLEKALTGVTAIEEVLRATRMV
jgi:general secretion pathway protein E